MSIFDGLYTSDEDAVVEPWTLREPCKKCSGTKGWLKRTPSGQNTVYCDACKTFLYCAPRSETGDPERKRSEARNGVSPGLRLNVLRRAGFSCELCHRSDLPLEAGHILSVADGRRSGLDLEPREINREDNLAAMCSECNSTLSRNSLNARQLALLIRNRTLLIDSQKVVAEDGLPNRGTPRRGSEIRDSGLEGIPPPQPD